MKKVTHTRGAGLLMGLFLALAGCAAGTMPVALVARQMTSAALVVAVDPMNRSVTLRFNDGTTRSYNLPDYVVNFDRIRVGNQVRATYTETVAMWVAKPGDVPDEAHAETVEGAPVGDKPGILVTDTIQENVRVESIDHAGRMMTVRKPSGKVKSYFVGRDVKQFDEVKAGDDIIVQVRQAMLLDVEVQ